MNSDQLLACYAMGQRDFSRQIFNSAKLSKVKLDFSVLTEAQFRRADLSEAHLVGVDLTQANLQQSNLTRANLVGAELIRANLQGCNLSSALLGGAILTGANLSGANLSGAAIAGADLGGVNLKGANLRQANLSGANLRAANLLSANLSQANLAGADLTGAVMPNGEVLLVDSSFDRAGLQTDENSSASDLHSDRFPSQAAALENQKTGADTNSDGRRNSNSHKKSDDRAAEADWLVSHHQPDEAAKRDDRKTIEAAKTQINLAILRRKGHFQLRQRLLKAYRHQCAISGCTIESVLEVASILPYAGADTYQPANGILLRADLHTLFDLHLLTIHPETRAVLIALEVQNGGYSNFANTALQLPEDPAAQPDPDLLKQHFQQCGWLESVLWAEAYSL